MSKPPRPAKRALRDLLVERGLFEDAGEAERWILAGHVVAAGRRDAKPGERFPEDADLIVRGISDRAYVTRGGLKLEAAIKQWSVPVAGAVCLDIGCAAGGFTDCLLQHGAARVYAVDAGTPRLALKLRRDGRVHVFEETNAAALPLARFDPPPTVLTVDVSYLAASAAVMEVTKPVPSLEYAIVLLKPIYELGRGDGDLAEKDYARAAEQFRERVSSEWRTEGVMDSPITGLRGAREMLVWLRRIERIV